VGIFLFLLPPFLFTHGSLDHFLVAVTPDALAVLHIIKVLINGVEKSQNNTYTYDLIKYHENLSVCGFGV